MSPQPFPAPTYFIHLQLFSFLSHPQTILDVASEALPNSSLYFYCQTPWMRNVCPSYPLFTRHRHPLGTLLSSFLSQMQNWHCFSEATSSLIHAGLESAILNLSLLPKCQPLQALPPAALQPPPTPTNKPKSIPVPAFFWVSMCTASRFSVVLSFLSFTPRACQFSSY